MAVIVTDKDVRPSAAPAAGRSPESAAVTDAATEDLVVRAYEAHGTEIYRFLTRTLADPGAAQDVTQEVFVKAWQRWDTFDPTRGSQRTWLFQIARNAAVDHLRALQVRPWHANPVDPQVRSLVDPAPGGSGPAPAQTAGHAEQIVDTMLVEDALTRISPEHRVAIVETYLHERPYSEVADDLGIPVGTLRSRVHYALRSLRSTMTELGWQQ